MAHAAGAGAGAAAPNPRGVHVQRFKMDGREFPDEYPQYVRNNFKADEAHDTATISESTSQRWRARERNLGHMQRMPRRGGAPFAFTRFGAYILYVWYALAPGSTYVLCKKWLALWRGVFAPGKVRAAPEARVPPES